MSSVGIRTDGSKKKYGAPLPFIRIYMLFEVKVLRQILKKEKQYITCVCVFCFIQSKLRINKQ